MQDKNERIVDAAIQRDKYRKNKEIKQKYERRFNDRENEKKLAREKAKADYDYMIYRSAEIEYEHDPITEVPDKVKLPADYFDEVAHKTDYNERYAYYYNKLYIDTNLIKYRNAAERIYGCHKSWFGDHYKKSAVFNVKRVFHCHNRWCWLCSHLQQAKRLYKFHLLFEKYLKDYDLYHLVFTVKNVKGKELEATLDKMKNAMYRIIRYFQGYGKISGIDFTQYGYVGGVRSFEIVINPTDYHPHIHVLLLLKKGFEFPKTKIVNPFSFNKGVLVRKFSEFEILLQKIFYLLVNGIKVNPKNINDLKRGYSCTMDHVEGDKWHEVFKYATKMSKEGASACTYEQFVLLDKILSSRKMIQGYGVFEGIDKEVETDMTAEILFAKVLYMLSRIEKPERDIHMELDKLVEQMHHDGITVISRKMSYKYMESIVEDLRAEFKLMAKDGDFPF